MIIANPTPTVFLVEDDADDRFLFENAFSEVAGDTTLFMAQDGMELMHLLHQSLSSLPRLIFLDLNMPQKSGFECLSEIRNSALLKHIPVVIFTTSTDKQYVDRGFDHGANYYLFKPNSFVKLKDAISKVMAINWSAEHSTPPRELFVLAC